MSHLLIHGEILLLLFILYKYIHIICIFISFYCNVMSFLHELQRDRIKELFLLQYDVPHSHFFGTCSHKISGSMLKSLFPRIRIAIIIIIIIIINDFETGAW